MTNMEQDRWSRVKGRLRSSVGEDVYTSWFARMDLESVQPESVRLSVPTRFLKSWIQAHYAERVLTCWQAAQFQHNTRGGKSPSYGSPLCHLVSIECFP